MNLHLFDQRWEFGTVHLFGLEEFVHQFEQEVWNRQWFKSVLLDLSQ